MSYIGNSPTTTAFVTDTFSGNGSTTAFTMSVAPAATSAVLVAISGVLQDPSTYSVAGTTLTFSAAPPSGTGNISARYLGIPASGVATTAYRTLTEFTATSGQTTFSVPSYVAGFINVFRNGAMLGTADYTATNGTTVVLAVGAVAGDLIAIESFYVSSVLNAIPNTAGAVQASNLAAGAARANFGAGAVLQVVTATKTDIWSTSSTSYVDVSGLSVSITPSSATSKFLVISDVFVGGASNNGFGLVQIVRNSTVLPINTSGTNGYNAYGNSGSLVNGSEYRPFTSAGVTYLDTPATSAALTYTVQSRTTGGTSYINRWALNADAVGVSSITLMEIAA